MRSPILLVALALLPTLPLLAQETDTPVVTAEDYARAERYLGRAMNPLVYRANVRPTWLEGDRFWYRNRVPEGTEFVLVDPERGTRERAFDHDIVASALSMTRGENYTAASLPFNTSLSEDGRAVVFEIEGETIECDTAGAACTRVESAAESVGRAFDISPDGRWAAFIRDHDLWVRNLEDGSEKALTTDGIEDFGYATNNAGWVRGPNPVMVWSPDSKKIATFQHDARGVGEMHLIRTKVGHPELQSWKYPLPEDSVIFRISRVVLDVEDGSMVRFDMPPDQHRSTTCDHVYCGGTWADNDWFEDGSHIAFVSTSRDHKEAHLRVANTETGVVRDVFSEVVETFYESGYNNVNWSVLEESNEVVWYSQRSNWGHLYLYDLTTGESKHPITSGEWNVLQVRHVDRENRVIYFTGAGREGGDPYFQYFYRVNMDGSGLTLLTPGTGTHTITLSPSGEYFVDTWSTPTTPSKSVLRNRDGDVVTELEEADITRLEEAGWQPPIPFTTKARDGVTELYGLMYRPSNFDPSKKYPVVNYLYPGPQTGSVGSRSFSAARRDHQAIAELGFVVIEVDAMGTPMRSKAFHDAYYGNMGDNGLPDQITTIRQLAERHDWIDIDRVGIWGHSGGGFASTAGILRYPDFYKVAVSQAGNHDNRNYEDDWGEKWQGLLVEYEDGTTNYDNQANQLVAGNLKGKLLLAHGTLDDNVPPSNTMVVVDALIEANKDFDLIMMTNRRHGFAYEPYMMRRRWDYFVRHLLGAEPPAGYEIGRRPIS